LILVENEGPIIWVFSRDEERKTVMKSIDFVPYFYIPATDGKYYSLTGERLKKKTLTSPKEMEGVRFNYDTTYESDIVYTNRYIIDNYYNQAITPVPIRIMYLDIEVDDSHGFEKIDQYAMPITAISFYDNFEKIYYTLLLKREEITIGGNHKVKSFNTERELLRFFMDVVCKLDPDLITAWNVDFDMPYILNRMKQNNLNINKLSRINKTFFFNDVMKIKGRVILDLLHAYRKLTQGEKSSYALEFVAQQELGEGKEKYRGVLNDLKDEKFILYSKRDVELLVMLDEKLKIIDFFDTIRRLAKVNFHDVFSNKRIIDSFVLCKAKRDGIVLPAQDPTNKRQTFEGAYVKEPPAGRHPWVVALDFKSLYPSIMMQFNMSYETLVVPGTELFKKLQEKNLLIKITDDTYFRKDIKGFANSVLEELMEERSKYKKAMRDALDKVEKHAYDQMQYAVKVIMNSYYGVTASPYFRLYKPKIAAAITYMGRQLIMHTENYLESKGYETVIADTDSTYIKTGAGSLKQAENIGNALTEQINDLWEDYLKGYNAQPNRKIIMEFEKIYQALLTIGVKKRYAGLVVWKDGQQTSQPRTDIKGMSVVRSDFPSRAQVFLKGMLQLILLGKGRNDCLKYIKEFKKDFKKGDIDEIGFPTSVKAEYKNNPIQLRASNNSREHLGLNIPAGSKIKYYFVKKTPKKIPFDDAWVFQGELPEGFELDWDRAFQRVITNPLTPIFDAMGWKLNYTLQDFIPEWK